VAPEEQVRPFNEQAALAELERLRESIQAARQARQRTSAEFDAFIKSFRAPTPAPAPERPTAPSPASEAPQQKASESINRPVHSPDPLPSTGPVRSNPDSVGDKPAVPTSQLPRRYRFSIRSLGILVVIAVIALGLVSMSLRRGVPPPTTVNTANGSAGPTRNPAASPPAASQSAPASPVARAIAIELRVLRPVWMRVVIDGRKDVEGTAQAGEPLHFTGDQSIVVRVGNGGDVLVKNGNREESFGVTGQPRTRTFSKF